jgi:hypothetical protein
MLLAEDLLLLVTDDASGRLSAPGAYVDIVLGGANLVELALLHKVGLSGDADGGQPGRIVVCDPSPADDEVLDAALAVIAARQGRKPSSVIRPLGKNLRLTLYGRLAAREVVRAGERTILGIFQVRRWPVQDTSHKAEVRQLIAEALALQSMPDAHTAALISLVHALRYESMIVDPRLYGMTKRQLRARGAEIAKGDWAPEAARTAIRDVIAAVAAARAAASSGG